MDFVRSFRNVVVMLEEKAETFCEEKRGVLNSDEEKYYLADACFRKLGQE